MLHDSSTSVSISIDDSIKIAIQHLIERGVHRNVFEEITSLNLKGLNVTWQEFKLRCNISDADMEAIRSTGLLTTETNGEGSIIAVHPVVLRAMRRYLQAEV
jgi:hypothetical protein